MTQKNNSKKQDLDYAINELEKDGTMHTYNKANELLFNNKGVLTQEQTEAILDKMKCLKCDRIYCDHQRPE